MSTQGRTSDQPEQTPQTEATTATPATGEGTNLLHRWVRLVQQSTLWGNDAGQVRLEELAQGPTTPRIQTLEEIRAARAAAVAEEEAAEGAGASSWWDDAICADDEAEAQAVDEVCETESLPESEEYPVCELDEATGDLGERTSEDGGYALEPQLGEMPPIFTLPPLVTPPTTVSPIPPALPAAAAEGVLARVLAFGARRLLPIIVGMLPKDTAPPELDQVPYTGPEGGLGPVLEPKPDPRTGCKSWTVEHLGDYEFHDWCADTIPDNTIPGLDLFVKPPDMPGLSFDAWTAHDNTVWEVKTDRYGKGSDEFNRMRVGAQAAKMELQNKVAEKCDYAFKVLVTDPIQAELLRELFGERIEVVYRPGCS